MHGGHAVIVDPAMKARVALAISGVLIVSAAAPVPAPLVEKVAPLPHSTDTPRDGARGWTSAPRLPPFGPRLSGLPVISAPQGWRAASSPPGWGGLIASQPATRQAARWAYATGQIASGRGAEALGALDIMRQDEPDLMLVPAYRLALGVTLAMLNRPAPALAALADASLAANSEACAWRMLALAKSGMAPQALGQFRCALSALNARPVALRAPFLLAIARTAADMGHPALAVQLVAALPVSDPSANLLRGRAAFKVGDLGRAMELISEARKASSTEQRFDADISLIEIAAAKGKLDGPATNLLREIRFRWRGGDVEVRALRLSYRIARESKDLRATLETGGTLSRYFDGGTDRASLTAELQQTLTAVLSPDNPMRLEQVAGLYWEYRDLAPAAADGDLLVSQLADRLQSEGLYERAAELLDHQLRFRTRDIAQGPLSARVATLFILAAKPERALSAIRDTDGNIYPDDMRWDRNRMVAVALDQIGRTEEAMAVLQDVPDGAAIRAEIAWKRHDWRTLAAAPLPASPGIAPLSDIVQAQLLRHATALAMMGRESDLAALRARWSGRFANLSTGTAFAALTAAVGGIDTATLSAAMAAIPSASPAGDIADLIDMAPNVVKPMG